MDLKLAVILLLLLKFSRFGFGAPVTSDSVDSSIPEVSSIAGERNHTSPSSETPESEVAIESEVAPTSLPAVTTPENIDPDALRVPRVSDITEGVLLPSTDESLANDTLPDWHIRDRYKPSELPPIDNKVFKEFSRLSKLTQYMLLDPKFAEDVSFKICINFVSDVYSTNVIISLP